ncbi:MAG: HDIG domain-containing protein [Candidatus Marinimicrobia bacterium]|nr:HDIG domain-containing protein [Candidatus Neomarinimicrobiota bacterium]
MNKNQNSFLSSLHEIPNNVLILYLLLTFVIVLFFPKNNYSKYNYKINDITREKIISPFDFPILKSQNELQEERRQAVKKIPAVFQSSDQSNRIEHFTSLIESLQTLHTQYNNLQANQSENNQQNSQDSVQFYNSLEKFKGRFDIKNEERPVFGIIYNQYDLKKLPLDTLKQIVRTYQGQKIANCPQDSILSNQIAVIDPTEKNKEILYNKNNILFQDSLHQGIISGIEDYFPKKDKQYKQLLEDILKIAIQPNLIYQTETTQNRQNIVRSKVPLSKGIVLENEKIVDANTKVDSEIYAKLESLNKARAKKIQNRSPFRRPLPLLGDPLIFLGRWIIVVIIFSLLLSFLYIHDLDILKDFKFSLLIALTFLLEVVVTNLFIYNFELSEFSIPVTIAALMFTIIFNSVTAFVVLSILCLLLGLQLGGNIYFIISSLVVSTLAIFSVRSLRKRIQVIKSVMYIVLGYLITISVTEIVQFSSFQEISNHFMVGSINGIFSPILTYGLIVFIEASLDITTDLGLLELADFNHPLLKKLSKEASGTFSHSVTVGNLAEAAADAVGANALLTRIGAYYHDIGKIAKPEYFIENQSYDINKHDNLKPNLSALVITNHVEEGLKLAKEYNLPEVVTKFIRTHHGSTTIEYFYQKAIEAAEDPDSINKEDYRYPGPKPDTKETAILMICESIEAATRSLKNPSLRKLERLVDKIINKKVEEGQLDESPLTFADLKNIKGNIEDNTGIMPTLKSEHHARVEYPDQQEDASESKNASDEEDKSKEKDS